MATIDEKIAQAERRAQELTKQLKQLKAQREKEHKRRLGDWGE